MKSSSILVLFAMFSAAKGFLLYPKCETTSHQRAQNQEITCTCNTGQGDVSLQENKYFIRFSCEQNSDHKNSLHSRLFFSGQKVKTQ